MTVPTSLVSYLNPLPELSPVSLATRTPEPRPHLRMSSPLPVTPTHPCHTAPETSSAAIPSIRSEINLKTLIN